ncbi:MAG: rod-binding protein [Cypionkella sp.]|jgi:Rod binding domain-containing protein|nr:rod-binding protein [Cypionkella sp.]
MQLDPLPPAPAGRDIDRGKLLETAKDLEVAFLSEMLAHAGLGESPDGFGGGAGEDQFASFLRHEHAKQLVDRGGIGLAQSIFESLITSAEAKHG